MDASFDRNVVFDIGNIFHLHTNIKKLETTHFIGCIKLTIFRQLGMEPHDSGNRPLRLSAEDIVVLLEAKVILTGNPFVCEAISI